MMTQSENLDRAASIAGSESCLNFCSELWVSASERYSFAPFRHCFGHFFPVGVWMNWIHAQCWSIAYSPPLDEISSWLQSRRSQKNLKKAHFLYVPQFPLNFTKISKTVEQAIGPGNPRAAAWLSSQILVQLVSSKHSYKMSCWLTKWAVDFKLSKALLEKWIIKIQLLPTIVDLNYDH